MSVGACAVEVGGCREVGRAANRQEERRAAKQTLHPVPDQHQPTFPPHFPRRLWLPSGAMRGRRRLLDSSAARRDGAVVNQQRAAPIACGAAPPGCTLGPDAASSRALAPARRVIAVLRNGCAGPARLRLQRSAGGGSDAAAAAAPPTPPTPTTITTACCCSRAHATGWPVFAPATCCCGPPGACCPAPGGGASGPNPLPPPPNVAGGFAGFAASYCEGRACSGLLAGTVFASVVFVGMGIALLIVFRQVHGAAARNARGPPPPPPSPWCRCPSSRWPR